MNHIISLYNKSEQELILLERACSELKRGNGVIIDNKFLIFNPETINNDFISKLQQKFDNISLLITKNRAKYIAQSYFNDDNLIIDINELNPDKIINIAITSTSDIDCKLDILNSYNIEITNAIIKINKIAELLPTAIIISLSQDEPDFIHITSNIINNYDYNSSKVAIISETNLNLRNMDKAKIIAFRNLSLGIEHYAIIIGDISKSNSPLIRIHSSCYTGDLLSSVSCDCREQLHSAMDIMNKSADGGIILYLMQEGRGIGLVSKLKTYNLQENGFDTVEANEILGFESDERSFAVASSMLNQMNINSVKILSNNPKKSKDLAKYNINITETVPIITDYHCKSHNYIRTKIEKMGHIIKEKPQK
jgi:GTP cyclohydrolase II